MLIKMADNFQRRVYRAVTNITNSYLPHMLDECIEYELAAQSTQEEIDKTMEGVKLMCISEKRNFLREEMFVYYHSDCTDEDVIITFLDDWENS